MTEEMALSVVEGIPNFVGFVLLGLFLYRALMASIANNRELAEQIIRCYETTHIRKVD